MILQNTLDWMHSRVLASIASHTVRSYFDLPWTMFEFSHSAHPQENLRNVTLSTGEPDVVKTSTFGAANKYGVSFIGKPNLYWAEHELTHFYHTRYNESVVDLVENYIEMKDQMESRKSFPLNKWFMLTKSWNVGMEAMASGFTDRERLHYFTGFVFKRSMQLPKSAIIEGLEQQVELPTNSIAHMTDFQSQGLTDDATTLSAQYKQSMKELQYNIGHASGSLFYVDNGSKPLVEVQTNLDAKSKKIILGVSIRYPLVSVHARRKILQDMFHNYINILSDNCVSKYSHMIDPYLREGYGKLALAVGKMAI